MYYEPVYGNLWPNVRKSLQRERKYCAVANNFSNVQDTIVDLVCMGGNDMFQTIEEEPYCDVTRDKFGRVTDGSDVSTDDDDEDVIEQRLGNNADLTEFVPAQRVPSSLEERVEEDLEVGFYNPTKSNIQILPAEPLVIPNHLKVFLKDKKDNSLFKSAKMDSSGKLNYYAMDAASVLPVLALGLRPDDSVLDLCAAPGGKTLLMLQTALLGELHCVDKSGSRMNRLKDIVRLYLPSSFLADGIVTCSTGDGIQFCEDNYKFVQYDKILVDVPCLTDRHAVTEEDNNIFKPSRRGERLSMPKMQKQMLCSALKSLKPGGTLVYSTCTLSMPQNDGVIQAALESVWRNSDMQVVVVDTADIVERFRNIFRFYRGTRFGQLVVPNIAANFGPMYFCKIKKLS